MGRISVQFVSVAVAVVLNVLPAHAQRMYWSTGVGGRILQANLDGSDVELLVSRTEGLLEFVLPREADGPLDAIPSLFGPIH